MIATILLLRDFMLAGTRGIGEWLRQAGAPPLPGMAGDPVTLEYFVNRRG